MRACGERETARRARPRKGTRNNTSITACVEELLETLLAHPCDKLGVQGVDYRFCIMYMYSSVLITPRPLMSTVENDDDNDENTLG